MNTHYVTFILRLRLNENDSQRAAKHGFFGSVQQAGLHEIRYFDSPEKLQKTLQELLPITTIPVVNKDQSSTEETKN